MSKISFFIAEFKILASVGAISNRAYYWSVYRNFAGKGRDSEIAPTEMFLLVGGNSDSRLLIRLAIFTKGRDSEIAPTEHLTVEGNSDS